MWKLRGAYTDKNFDEFYSILRDSRNKISSDEFMLKCVGACVQEWRASWCIVLAVASVRHCLAALCLLATGCAGAALWPGVGGVHYRYLQPLVDSFRALVLQTVIKPYRQVSLDFLAAVRVLVASAGACMARVRTLFALALPLPPPPPALGLLSLLASGALSVPASEGGSLVCRLRHCALVCVCMCLCIRVCGCVCVCAARCSACERHAGGS
jgi:hypothetical protein